MSSLSNIQDIVYGRKSFILQSVLQIGIKETRWLHILKSFLTIFVLSVESWGNWGNSKNWLGLKVEPPYANLASPKQWNTVYDQVLFTAPKTFK